MSLNEANYCPVQHQEMIIKPQAIEEDIKFEDSLLLAFSKLKCEDEQKYSSCDQSSGLKNLENIFAPFPIKQEPDDLGADDVHQVQAENLAVKEEKIEIEEHKPEWKPPIPSNSTSNVVIFKDGLDRCESDQGNQLRPSQSMKEGNKFNCPHCPYKTNKKSNFIDHFKCKHSKEAEVYKCEECAFETKYKNSFNQHYKIKHVKETEVYKCRECSYETKNKSSLTRHYKCKHSKDAEVYKCQECSYETRRKHHLTLHSKCRHLKGSEVYKCQECSYENRRKDHLTRHYKYKHSNVAEVYKCQECSFQTKYKCSLIEHYKCKHAKERRDIGCPFSKI